MTSHRREAPFSFYCTICYAPFDPDVNYPVVLPCGHTYLCHPCASRLKRCMECRTSLFIEQMVMDPPLPDAEQGSNGSGAELKQVDWLTHVQPVYQRQTMSMRTSPRVFMQGSASGKTGGLNSGTSVVMMKQVPVPLPKNYVLLDVLEASTKFQSREAAKKRCCESKNEYSEAADYEEYDSDDDRSYVYSGLDVINESCGTYAVITDDAIVLKSLPENISSNHGSVFADKNNRGLSKPSSTVNRERHSLDELMKTFDIQVDDESVNVVAGPSFDLPMRTNSRHDTRNSNSGMVELRHSDLIQVVTIKDGFAKLARKRGYVRVEYSNIVKVSGPRDVACRIEAMMLSLANEVYDVNQGKQNISEKMCSLKNQFEKTMKEEDYSFPEKASLQEMARLPCNNTNISPSKSQSHDCTENEVYISSPGSNASAHIGTTSPIQNLSPSDPMSGPRRPSPSILRTATSLRSVDDPPQEVSFNDNNATYTPSPEGSTAAPLFGISPENTFNLAMPRLTQVQNTSQEHIDEFVNSSPFLCTDIFGLMSDDEQAPVSSDLVRGNPLFDEVSSNTETSLLSPRSRPPDVNFRTGMSGHQALLSNKAHTSVTHSRYTSRTMSSHSGVLQSRRRKDSPRDDDNLASSPGLQNTKTW